MMNSSASVSIATQSKYCRELRQATGKEIADGPPLPVSGPLQIERPSTEPIVRPPYKGVIHKSSYNPNACAAQHYSIFDDLA